VPVAAPVSAPVAIPAQVAPASMMPPNMMEMMKRMQTGAAPANVEMRDEGEGPSDHERNMRLMQEKFGAIIKADK